MSGINLRVMSSSLKIPMPSKKHKKLNENWADSGESVIEGQQFVAKYLGSTLVDGPKGEDMSASAIKRIVAMSKASGQQIPAVLVTVSARNILITNHESGKIIDDVDISRISYCTADKHHGKVFGYVMQNKAHDTFECHAYMCGSRKEAQAVTLTVAQAFSVAYDLWKTSKVDNKEMNDVNKTFPGVLDHIEHNESPKSATVKAESKYRRLSDGEEVMKYSPTTTVDATSEPSVTFNPSSQDNTSPFQPIKPLQRPTKSADVAVIKLPPPTGKLVDVAQTASNKTEKKQHERTESEDLEFGFAQLAMSRT